MLKVPLCNRPGDSAMDLDITSSTSLESDVINTSSLKLGDTKSYDSTAGDSPVYTYRQNHVSHVMLGGVHIVSLHIDGKERLCLAQISNTLLKQFSYNEIHNRRVALGITCVQCTPVQLEILRRAGAMPISSRRCGMITKREAERLVKSFLEDNKPPKLPENFYFEVHHQCGWGCRGKFEPARYNSSRAKCIKCSFCNLYFSPNKFIFHFHRTPESKYNHPDAANFNSWRRHLHLVSGTDLEDTIHAWEDVKAMFNGGSRKRMVSSPPFPDSRHQQTEPAEVKKQKMQIEDNILTKPNFRPPYQNYPIFTMPGNTYPFGPLATPNPLALPYHLGKAEIRDERKPQNLPVPWRPASDFIIPTYDFLWANQFGARPNGLQHFRPNFFPASSSPVKDLSISESDRKTPSENMNSSEDEENLSPLNVPTDSLKSSGQRLSAFKPVFKYSDKCRTDSSDCKPVCSSAVNDIELDNDDLDVGINEEYIAKSAKPTECVGETRDGECSPDTSTVSINESCAKVDKDNNDVPCAFKMAKQDEIKMVEQDGGSSKLTEERDINSNKEPCVNFEDISQMSKEDLQRLLQKEMDLRRQVESDISKIKEKLEDQLSKQKQQRDSTSSSLESSNKGSAHSVTSTDILCNELEHERKIRLSMQQKLKEAQQNLHNFSCNLLSSRQCNDYTIPGGPTVLPR